MTSTDLLLRGIEAVADMLIVEVLNNERKKKRRKKQIWTRKWVLRRNEQGASENFLREVEVEDPKTYKNHLRLNSEQFEYLLEKVAPKVQKADTHMRKAIPAKVKLQIALRYLATGDSFSSLESHFRVPKCSISLFLTSVLDAIYVALEEFKQVPDTAEEWTATSRGYNNRWNFPDCCGALDGKHINIQQPEDSGSDFFNYKGYFSTVLLALVDANYCFTYIDVGSQGRLNDASIFSNSVLKKKLENGALNFPSWGVILGDEAFPLKNYLMKPYSRRLPLTDEKTIFNYRLSRARRIVENAFGIMTSKFRIYRTPIYLCPDKVDKIVKATCALHNWLMKTALHCYAPIGTVDTDDQPGSWRQEPASSYIRDLVQQGSNNPSRLAEQKRTDYTNYFSREGAVPWQKSRIF